MKCEKCDIKYFGADMLYCSSCGKRLGSSESGAEPCFAGRAAAGEQGAAEARSEEGLRVSPGEARLHNALEILKRAAFEYAAWGSYRDDPEWRAYKAEWLADLEMAAVGYKDAVLGEPDSEACRNLSAPHENPAPKMPEDVELPFNERSGRRNA